MLQVNLSIQRSRRPYLDGTLRVTDQSASRYDVESIMSTLGGNIGRLNYNLSLTSEVQEVGEGSEAATSQGAEGSVAPAVPEAIREELQLGPDATVEQVVKRIHDFTLAAAIAATARLNEKKMPATNKATKKPAKKPAKKAKK